MLIMDGLLRLFMGEDAEEKASDFADEYYAETGCDCRYDEIHLLEV